MSGHVTVRPPSPIWEDETSGVGVWVNGAFVEITTGGGFTRITPAEASALPHAFALAVAEACAWANRWDPLSQTYTPV